MAQWVRCSIVGLKRLMQPYLPFIFLFFFYPDVTFAAFSSTPTDSTGETDPPEGLQHQTSVSVYGLYTLLFGTLCFMQPLPYVLLLLLFSERVSNSIQRTRTQVLQYQRSLMSGGET